MENTQKKVAVYPFIKKNDSITILIDGQSKTVRRENANYLKVLQALKNEDWELVAVLVNTADAVTQYMQGGIQISGGVVYHNGEVVNNVVVERIMQAMNEGMPHGGLVKFLEKVLLNPSYNSREQLYKFLENKFLPITPEGNFMAYKAITNEYMDKWTRTISNEIGAEPRVPRHTVDDNPTHHCSKGLHCGSIEYVRQYGSSYGVEGGDRIVLVEVNPVDVVSVPDDHNCQKLRSCGYKVVGEYNGDLPKAIHDPENPYTEDLDEDYYEENEEAWNLYDEEEELDDFVW